MNGSVMFRGNNKNAVFIKRYKEQESVMGHDCQRSEDICFCIFYDSF